MGQRLSQLVNESTDKESKEALKFLNTMVVSKIKSLEQELLNPPSNNHMVHIGTIVDRVEDIYVNASVSSDVCICNACSPLTHTHIFFVIMY